MIFRQYLATCRTCQSSSICLYPFYSEKINLMVKVRRTTTYRGVALSGGTDHDSLQAHWEELVTPTTVWLPDCFQERDAIPGYDAELCFKSGTPTTTVCLHELFKKRDAIPGYDAELCSKSATPTTIVCLPELFNKRDAIPGYDAELCFKLLIGPFQEAVSFGARVTDAAIAFSRMEIDHVEYLLVHPEGKRSTLQRLNTIAEDQDTRSRTAEKVLARPGNWPEVWHNLPVDALPELLLPDIIELIDDGSIKLTIFEDQVANLRMNGPEM